MSERLSWDIVQKRFGGQWIELADYHWDWGSPFPTWVIVSRFATQRSKLFSDVPNKGSIGRDIAPLDIPALDIPALDIPAQRLSIEKLTSESVSRRVPEFAGQNPLTLPPTKRNTDSEEESNRVILLVSPSYTVLQRDHESVG